MLDLLFGIASIVANLMFLDMDTSIPTLLTYIMSTHNVTFRYRFEMSAGMGVTGESTIGGFLCVVFPFKDPISGPNMCSAASTSAGVTGQLAIMFLFNKSTNVAVLGHSTLIWSSRALSAHR